MEMDWQIVLISFITACVPASIAYLTASKQAKVQLQQVEKNNQAELVKMKLEYELRLKEKESDAQNDMVNKLFTGDIDLGNIENTMTQLEKITRTANNLSGSKYFNSK